MRIVSFVVVLLISGLISTVNAQRPYPAQIEGSKEYTYKTVGDTKLNLWVFKPESQKSFERLPAIVFFFGGGWAKGSPVQFEEHCKYLSARGMIAITADYRVKNRHGVQAKDCVADAKSAIRWVRQNAEMLGIDPERIVGAGASAGGHLAASAAMLPQFDEPGEDITISSKPDALVLFNPVLILPPVEYFDDNPNRSLKPLEQKFGTSLENISPYHHIKSELPPSLIFHGTEDGVVAYRSIQMFTEKMHEYDNDCTLFGYDGESHGFFNYGKKSNASYIDTVYKMDKFLVALGYLKPIPAVETLEN